MERTRAIAQAQSLIASHPGVVSVGYGLKERGGAITGIQALRVYVRSKRALDSLGPCERIPADFGGLPTDVIEHSPAAPSAGRRAGEPSSGSRIANAKGVPGTLGCLCRRDGDGSAAILTSWHVLFGAGARERSKIWAIEERDGVRRAREIGVSLYGFIGTVSMDGERFHIDCAVGSRAATAHRRAAAMRRDATAVPGDRVTKDGSATGETAGVVVDVAYPDLALIENRAFTAPRQVLVRSLDPARSFSGEGDSGAAVLNERREVVGLLWGTNCRGEGVACHIQPVLRNLRISIDTVRPATLKESVANLFRRRDAKPCN